jgi:hypothetical protein
MNQDTISYKLAFDQFINEGLAHHLSGCIGGFKPPQTIKTIIKRATNCITWCYFKMNGFAIDLKEISIVDCLNDILSKNYTVVHEYTLYLEKTKEMTPSTICNHLYDIVAVAEWMKYFCSTQNYSNTLELDLTGFKLVIAALKKNYSRKMKSIRTENDVTECIKARRFPLNGLTDLMLCINNELKWARKFFLNESWILRFDELIYTRLMSILYASLYVFSPQGRKGGIESLQLKDGDTMIRQGHANSKLFKTRSSFGYQPCTLSKKSYFLFKIYFERLRPLISSESEFKCHQTDPLWLTWAGVGDTTIGKKITKLFKKKLGLHITTTVIRTIVETEAHHLFIQGKISESDRTAISNINGHSSKTTESYYLQSDRDSDVFKGRNIFHRLESDLGIEDKESDEDNFLRQSNNSWIPLQIVMPDWGTSHPDYKKRPKMLRAKWSKDEIDYIREWCVQKLEENHEIKAIIISLLWKHITRGPDNQRAIPIFHEIHILDSARLRHGYRVAQINSPELQN